ncbi:unnamed protein product [Schistosoma margrebowiei]|uniref:Uncharacterized protein n=1 Tax=Schistosoma margrebowiei TaxID=48269 RepID=A0A183M9V0_9TREM|nr:unnamed protein product [Schistosoma margrebowiei]
MQAKTTSLAVACASVGLNMLKSKSKVFKFNTKNIIVITFDEETPEDVGNFQTSEVASILSKGGSQSPMKNSQLRTENLSSLISKLKHPRMIRTTEYSNNNNNNNNNNLFSNNSLLHEACQFTGKIKLIQMTQYTNKLHSWVDNL